MRPTWLRWLALLLSALLIVSMTACGGGGDKTTDPTDSQSGDGGDGKPPVKDLGGYVFKVRDYFQTRWEPEPGTPMNDAILGIIEDIENEYNCDIQFEVLSVDNAVDLVRSEVVAGGKFADLVITTMWNFSNLLGAGLMGDLKTIKTMDLSHKYWNQNILKTVNIENKVLACAAPFTSHTYLTWSCYFNKRIFSEIQQKHGFEDPYTLVYEGRWTYDKFIEMAKAAMADLDGNGVVDSPDDRWGMVAPDGDYCRAAFMAMGGRFYETDESGRVRMASGSQHALNVVAKLQKMIKQDKIYGSVLSSGKSFNDIIGAFIDGKALFICCSPGESALKDMKDDFGFLPQPKYDEQQEDYIGMVDHNAPLFGITNTLPDADKEPVGYILEALAYRFQEIEEMQMQEWDDTIWRDPDVDGDIVRKYIYRKGGYDLAPIVQNSRQVLGAPMNLVFAAVFGGITDYASAVEAQQDRINAEITAFMAGANKAAEEGPTTTTTETAATEAAE